jgi:GTP-sensing pleiotropic transcriptional regulator CodY
MQMMNKAQELQDELDYQELIARVAEIDKDAAAYMLYEMRKCFGFSTSGDLWEVVIWEHTKQGTDYWYDIAQKIGH